MSDELHRALGRVEEGVNSLRRELKITTQSLAGEQEKQAKISSDNRKVVREELADLRADMTRIDENTKAVSEKLDRIEPTFRNVVTISERLKGVRWFLWAALVVISALGYGAFSRLAALFK